MAGSSLRSGAMAKGFLINVQKWPPRICGLCRYAHIFCLYE